MIISITIYPPKQYSIKLRNYISQQESIYRERGRNKITLVSQSPRNIARYFLGIRPDHNETYADPLHMSRDAKTTYSIWKGILGRMCI